MRRYVGKKEENTGDEAKISYQLTDRKLDTNMDSQMTQDTQEYYNNKRKIQKTAMGDPRKSSKTSLQNSKDKLSSS